jgi:nucleotide-binding universal stress UspA family protein
MRRLVIAALALAVCGCASPVVPDLVVTNAKVFTNDAARPWAEAVAVKGERVIAVGSTTEIAALAAPQTRRVDAGGRVLVPGFNDARVDLPLDAPPTPASLAELDRRAIAQGVTSLQVVAGGPMRTLVEAARAAERQARWRLIRSPQDTVTLAIADPRAIARQDEEPFLPPQPGVRLTADGIAWHLASGERTWRRPLDGGDVDQVLGWAYGAEDPLVFAGNPALWLAGLKRVGVVEVWRQKRPRYDVVGPGAFPERVADFAPLGIATTWTPAALRRAAPGPGPLSSPWQFPGPYVDAGVTVSLGSGDMAGPTRVVASAMGAGAEASGRPLTREEAVRAMTWGSAYAEKAERDKGWLGPGTLADIAILSGDIFIVPTEQVASITSVLTMVGGAIVYDPGVLPR